jgi:molybdate transport system ATP-binding protein
MSVRGNLSYGRRSDARRVSLERVVEMLEIGALVSRAVDGLSGGEKQRVALARALLSSPRLLLLDEPLASLDAPLRTRILPYLERVRDELRIPMLYVTHDRYEALALAEDMVVLHGGRVAQRGPIREVLSRPASLEVAGILTMETIVPGRLVAREAGLAVVAVGETRIVALDEGLAPGAEHVHVGIRAEDVTLVADLDVAGSPRNRWPATVRAIHGDGPAVRVDLDCGFPLAAILTKRALEDLRLAPGSRVVAWVKAPRVHLIARSG